jgi:hypothetical protein
MKAASQKAYEWVEELVPNTWIKAFFSDFPKCDMLLNNHSEVFNRYNISSFCTQCSDNTTSEDNVVIKIIFS